MYDLSNREENSQVRLKVCELQYPSYKLKNMIIKKNWDTFKSLDITENTTHLWPQVVYFCGQLAILQQMSNLL